MRPGVLLLGAAALTACADIPASPTYVDDVRAVLRANCVRCHGAPAGCTPLDRRGYRLDHWADAGDVAGVATMTERITVRAVDLGDMPPDSELGDRERELLRRWQRAGSPRGEPATDLPPALELRSPVPATEPADRHLRLDVDVRDPDSNALTWTAGWQRDGLAGELTPTRPAGRQTVDLDLGVLAPGTYQLVARLRGELADGPLEVPLGAPLTIPDRDAAPTATLLYPRGGERLARSSPIDITWRADDVDTAGPLTARLRLLAADGTALDIATDLDARTPPFRWSPATFPAGTFHVELTISDSSSTRSAITPCPITLLP